MPNRPTTAQYSTTEQLPQTKEYFVKIRKRNSSSFSEGSIISWEEFKEDDRQVRERGERPASIEIVREPHPSNGNGSKELPATIRGEPIPDKYRELTPFIDEPLPPGTDFLVPAVVTEEGERKIDAVLRQLKDGIEGIQDSSQFRLFLTTMSKFHDYSIGNLILIAIQKPAATRVAGFQTWKDLDRWVKKGESGIAILAPVMPPKPKKEEREDEEEEVALVPINFKVVHVFDISQTEGKPLPEFEVPVLTGEANEELFAKVLALAKAQGLDVSFESRPHQDPAIKGQYSPATGIWVRPEEPRAQQLKSLAHEIAHYYSEGVFRIPRHDAETIAESAAYAVGAHFGFDSGTRSFPYVALWAQDKKVLQANLASIRKVTTSMLEGMEGDQGVVTSAIQTRAPVWKQYKEGEKLPVHSGKPLIGRWDYSKEVRSIEPIYHSNKRLSGYLPQNMKREESITQILSKESYREFTEYIDTNIGEWAKKMETPPPEWLISAGDNCFYSSDMRIVLPAGMARLYQSRSYLKEYPHLLYWVAHEFFHYVAETKKLSFADDIGEEDYTNKLAEHYTGIGAREAYIALHKLLRKVWNNELGEITLEDALGQIPSDRKPDEKWLPALKPFEPYHFAEFVLRYNRFSDAEIPIYSGLTGRNPLRVPDHIWREVIEGTEGEFVKQGDISVFHIPEKERPAYMRAAPTWRDIASTVPQFKPGEIVKYKDEKVRVEEHIGDRVSIWIPSRQEQVWVTLDKLERIEEKPAVIPTKPSTPSPREELEFISDSPELIPFTIEEIGYREKLDNAFEAAIARAKGG